jgi:molybdopterin converting factor small subunit
MSEQKIKIMVFGQLTESIGASVLETELQSDVQTLKEHLLSKYPQLTDRRFVLAVNKEISGGHRLLSAGDEIALLPPFSGG